MNAPRSREPIVSTELPSGGAASAGGTIGPHCVFVSGPPRAGKTRWLQERIRALAAGPPPARCAVLLAEEGRTRWENFAREVPRLAVHRLVLPCLCCPGLANVPSAVQSLAASSGADWLFVEVPALAAAGVIAEFDRALGWPRQVVICPGAAWEAVPRTEELPFFLSNLLALADTVVTQSSELAPGNLPGAARMPGSFFKADSAPARSQM